MADTILCTVCNSNQSIDLHHIEHRMKNNPKLNEVNNIIALCRHHHEQAHAGILDKEYLKQLQKRVMENK